MPHYPPRHLANFAEVISRHVPKRLRQIEQAGNHLRHLTRTPSKPHRRGG